MPTVEKLALMLIDEYCATRSREHCNMTVVHQILPSHSSDSLRYTDKHRGEGYVGRGECTSLGMSGWKHTPMLAGRIAVAAVMKLIWVRLTAPTVRFPVDCHVLVAASKEVPGVRLGLSVSVPGEKSSGNETPAAQH
jgi:hypothetical protein